MNLAVEAFKALRSFCARLVSVFIGLVVWVVTPAFPAVFPVSFASAWNQIVAFFVVNLAAWLLIGWGLRL